jgi:hypothetical protein
VFALQETDVGRVATFIYTVIALWNFDAESAFLVGEDGANDIVYLDLIAYAECAERWVEGL